MSTAFATGVLGEEPFAGYPFSPPTPEPTGPVFPLLLLEEAFPSDPLAEAPTFIDLGQNNALMFDTAQNNRSSQLDGPSAGTGRFTMDCRQSRDLDPNNPSSPHAPNVTPNRRVRLRIIADAVTFAIWEGFADRHNMRYEMPANAFCDLDATDAFKILANWPLTGMPARPKERADVRVTAILDWVGWPSSRRAISTPARTILIAEDVSDRNALDALQQINDTECGRLDVLPDGSVRFLSRIDMQSAERQAVSQATFSDSGEEGTIPYQSGLVLDSSETMIRNIVRISTPGGETIEVVDEASRAFYGPQVFEREVRDVTEAARRATAEQFLAAYKDLFTRVTSLSVLTSDYPPGFPTGLYAQMAQLQIGDRVTVERHHLGGDEVGEDVGETFGESEPFVQECFIESKTDAADIDSKLWVTTLGLSYAPPVVAGSKWGSGKWGTAKWGW